MKLQLCQRMVTWIITYQWKVHLVLNIIENRRQYLFELTVPFPQRGAPIGIQLTYCNYFNRKCVTRSEQNHVRKDHSQLKKQSCLYLNHWNTRKKHCNAGALQNYKSTFNTEYKKSSCNFFQ